MTREIFEKQRLRKDVYKDALTRSMARLEKKIEGRTRVVQMAKEMQVNRIKEDWIWILLTFAVGIYVMGMPW